jgi:hypothetical protein
MADLSGAAEEQGDTQPGMPVVVDHRDPQLLEHRSEVFPQHVPIHYGRYRRKERFEGRPPVAGPGVLADGHRCRQSYEQTYLRSLPERWRVVLEGRVQG